MQNLDAQIQSAFEAAVPDLQNSLLICDKLFDDGTQGDVDRARKEARELLKQKPSNYFDSRDLERAINKHSDLSSGEAFDLAKALQAEMMRDS